MTFDRYTSRLIQTCILLSLLARLTAASALQPSTTWVPSTTLPEAVQPSATTLTDEALQCDFENLQSLVDHVIGVNRTSYNISVLVDTCPDVCELVYGAGNPDISGVGAVISYTLQGVTSLIFGPALALLSLYLGSDKSADSWLAYDPEKLWVAKYFLPIAGSLHTANIITACSVLLAAVIRISGDLLPLGESKFLLTLARFEFLTCWVCTLSFLPLHTSSKPQKRALGSYVLATFILWMIATLSGRGLPTSVMEAITSACIDNRDGAHPVGTVILQLTTASISNSSSSTASATLQTPMTTREAFEEMAILFFGTLLAIIPAAIGITILVFLFYCVPFVSWHLLLLFISLSKVPFLKSAGLLGVGPQRMGALTFAFALGSAATVSTWWFLADLLRQREQLRAFAGNRYEDNDWGFGQITAVMTWTPVLQETVFAVIRTIIYYKSPEPSSPEDTEQATELVSLLPAEIPPEAGVPAVTPEPVPLSSAEDSDADAEPQPPTPISTNFTESQNPSNVAHSTSSQTGPDGATLQPRSTWPRNESGTYLPR